MDVIKYVRFDISESVGGVEDAQKLVEQFPTKLELLIPENQREPLMFVLYSYVNIMEFEKLTHNAQPQEGVFCPVTKLPAEFDEQYLKDNLASPTTLGDAASYVQLFHEVFGHKVRYTPELLNTQEKEFRYKLMLEELIEFLHSKTEEEQFDAMLDMMYILLGTFVQSGHNTGNLIERGLLEVQRSNMTKLGADGKPVVREDGKIMKSELYEAPKLSEVLNLKSKDNVEGTN